jgi:hypothetical protein
MREYNSLTRILVAAFLLLACNVYDGHAATQRPIIKVAIGMPADQLQADSTYPFTATTLNVQATGEAIPPTGGRPVHDWVITQPYDLVYVYAGRELKADNLGGSNYLVAISCASEAKPIVDHVQITFQNRALTLDEALVEAKKLDDWFLMAGFHLRSPNGPDPGRLAVPFYVEDQERLAPKFAHPITDYKGVRAAFLDPQAKVISVMPFDLETDDAYASLEIVNARRRREGTDGNRDESVADEEREYFLNLSISARPTNRY